MAFNTYGAEQSEKRESNVDYDALNKYVVEDFKGEIKKTIDELKKENIKIVVRRKVKK